MPSGDFLIPLNYWHIPDDLSTAISLKEACKTYFYSRNALIWQIKKGYIQGFKLNRKWYLMPANLKKQNKVSST
ncbi:hypothetical protein [Nostoc sp.]